MGTRQVELSVNGAPIEMDYFVQRFVDHVMEGIVAGLHDTGEVETLNLSLDEESAALELNGRPVPMNEFVTLIVRNTVFGMVSSLKGVDEVDRVGIAIQR